MNTAALIEKLKFKPTENAWAIQDLVNWPEQSQFYYADSPDGLSYVLISGHPSQKKGYTVIMDDEGGVIDGLLKHLPKGEVIIRETNSKLLPKLQPLYPNAKIFQEQRMEVTRKTFRPRDGLSARRITVGDAAAMAEFYGAPPQAAEGFKSWISGALILAVFDGNRIVSLGTTIVRTESAWILAEIITDPEERGQGYASDVTASLTALGLESVPVVSLTVKKDNAAALKVYSKLGFQACEDRIWLSNAVDAAP